MSNKLTAFSSAIFFIIRIACIIILCFINILYFSFFLIEVAVLVFIFKYYTAFLSLVKIKNLIKNAIVSYVSSLYRRKIIFSILSHCLPLPLFLFFRIFDWINFTNSPGFTRNYEMMLKKEKERRRKRGRTENSLI